jgi:hypothetical protein
MSINDFEQQNSSLMGYAINGMNGAENLAFDNNNFLYITTLDGMLYKVAPGFSGDPSRIQIIKRIRLGEACRGIDIDDNGWLYVGVDKGKKRNIYRIDNEFCDQKLLVEDIPGLNGITLDTTGFLYYTTSSSNPFARNGKICRIKISPFGGDIYDPDDLPEPEIVLQDLGMVNGLAVYRSTAEKQILYFTQTYKGVFSVDLSKWGTTTAGNIKPFFSLKGCGCIAAFCDHIYDDLTVTADGTVWVCLNSEQAVVSIKNGSAGVMYTSPDLGAPSSCKFSKGKGMQSTSLYITEVAQKGCSLKFNGRGIWILARENIGLREVQ